MGYQEAYVTTKNKKEFEDFCNHLKSLGKEYFDNWGSYPCDIITFTKDHFPFKNGDKVVYFCGERYPLYYFMKKDDYNKERFTKNTFKLNIKFTEEVNPKGIWADCGEVTDCQFEPLFTE